MNYLELAIRINKVMENGDSVRMMLLEYGHIQVQLGMSFAHLYITHKEFLILSGFLQEKFELITHNIKKQLT